MKVSHGEVQCEVVLKTEGCEQDEEGEGWLSLNVGPAGGGRAGVRANQPEIP